MSITLYVVKYFFKFQLSWKEALDLEHERLPVLQITMTHKLISYN